MRGGSRGLRFRPYFSRHDGTASGGSPNGSFFGQYLSAFAAQFLHACPDRSKVVGGARPGALAAQLLHPCPDHRKIVSDAGSGYVPSVFF
jgi:hypothetical protein